MVSIVLMFLRQLSKRGYSTETLVKFNRFGRAHKFLKKGDALIVTTSNTQIEYIDEKIRDKIVDKIYDVIMDNDDAKELTPLIQSLKDEKLITEDQDEIYYNLCRRYSYIRAARYLEKLKEIPQPDPSIESAERVVDFTVRCIRWTGISIVILGLCQML
jgi:hypothetical protein